MAAFINPVIPGKTTARLEGDFVVFLIGMRVNAWWKLHKWLPVFLATRPMLRELSDRPELGYLGGTAWIGGRATLLVQYWRSVEQLEAYARDPELAHRPAWRAFHRAIGGSGDVGIYHESYQVRAGDWEVLSVNMPPLGMTAVGDHTPVTRATEGAARRRSVHRPGPSGLVRRAQPGTNEG